MPLPPLPDLGTLPFAEVERLVAGAAPLPVDCWNPPSCGDSVMRIARDGSWYHQGSRIERPELVRVFSRILRREPDGRHVLVTPVEKLDIAVDDAPFVAVELRVEGSGRLARLAFRLNTGELVMADAAHPIRVEHGAEGTRPYLGVRGGLAALIARPVYYRLADLVVAHDGREGIWSAGCFFALDAAA